MGEKKRKEAAKKYSEAFKGQENIITPKIGSVCLSEMQCEHCDCHVFHQYTMTLEGADRDGLNAFLAERDIPSMIYYPVPAHRQKMFDAFNSADTELPVTDWLTERVISLPIHTEMDKEQLDYICQGVADFLTK